MSGAASRSDDVTRDRGDAGISGLRLLRVGLRSRDGTHGARRICARRDASRRGFPRPVDWTEVVTLNTSGGIAGGDRLRSEIVVGDRRARDVRLAGGGTLTTARCRTTRPRACARRSPSAPARQRNGCRRRRILFDRCAVDRVLDVDVAADGWFLGVESLVFGRTAMGESVGSARLSRTRSACGATARSFCTTRSAVDGPVGGVARAPGRREWRTRGGDDRACGARCSSASWMRARGARALRRRRERVERDAARADRRAPTARLFVARSSSGLQTMRDGRSLPRVGCVEGSRMNLTPREKDKLLISMAAMVARRRLERGVKLNHPEAVALITRRRGRGRARRPQRSPI